MDNTNLVQLPWWVGCIGVIYGGTRGTYQYPTFWSSGTVPHFSWHIWRIFCQLLSQWRSVETKTVFGRGSARTAMGAHDAHPCLKLDGEGISLPIFTFSSSWIGTPLLGQSYAPGGLLHLVQRVYRRQRGVDIQNSRLAHCNWPSMQEYWTER